MCRIVHGLGLLLLAAFSGSGAAQQSIDAPTLKPFADGVQWMLVDAVEYRVGDTAVKIVVPGGFVTDFASIPQWLWSTGLAPNGRYSKAAIVHDFLYWSQGCTRAQSDNLLMIAMKESDVGWTTRNWVFNGVRIGGNAAWDRNQQEVAQRLPRVIPAGLRQFGPNVDWVGYRETLRLGGTLDPVFPASPPYCALGDTTDVPGAPTN